MCEGRAAGLGWLPADQEGAEETLRAESTRRPGFFARLFTKKDDSLEMKAPAPRRAISDDERRRIAEAKALVDEAFSES